MNAPGSLSTRREHLGGGAACFTTLSECSPRNAPKPRLKWSSIGENDRSWIGEWPGIGQYRLGHTVNVASITAIVDPCTLTRGIGRRDWQALVSWNLPQQPFKILDGLHQSIAQLHPGRPAEQVLR